MAARIEVYRSGTIRQRYRFRFVAGNGEIVAPSQGYSRREDAVNTARLIATAFVDMPVYDADSNELLLDPLDNPLEPDA